MTSSLCLLLVSSCLVSYHSECAKFVDAFSGAGIYAATADDVSLGPITNNGLIISRHDALKVECVSNSSVAGVGSITTSGGAILTPDTTPSTLKLNNPFSRPGVLRLQSIVEGKPKSSHHLRESDQGIYTCNIPDDNGNVISLNFGLYPPEFDGEP